MAQMKRHTFIVDADLLDRMTAVRARTGLSQNEQVRRGINLWLSAREWPVRAADGRKGAASRALPAFLGLPWDVEDRHA